MEKADKAAGEAAKRGENGSKAGRATRYGEAVKRLVVEQLDEGKLTISQAQRQYGVAGSQTIRLWQRKYGKAGGGVRRASALAGAQARIERLEREKADLEHALARASVKTIALESLMEEAEAQYGEGFKKNFGLALSSVRGNGFVKRERGGR